MMSPSLDEELVTMSNNPKWLIPLETTLSLLTGWILTATVARTPTNAVKNFMFEVDEMVDDNCGHGGEGIYQIYV